MLLYGLCDHWYNKAAWTPPGMQLWDAPKCKFHLIYLRGVCGFALMWKGVVMNLIVWLFQLHNESVPQIPPWFLQIWPQGLWTVCWKRGVPIWESENKPFKKLESSQKRKRHLLDWGRLKPASPERNHGGNLKWPLTYPPSHLLQPLWLSAQHPNPEPRTLSFTERENLT